MRSEEGRSSSSTSRLVIGLGAALLAGGCITPAIARSDRVDFSTTEIETGRAPFQRLLTAPLLGAEVDDLVLIDAGPRAQGVRIRAFDGKTWSSAREFPLRPGVLFVDVATLGGRERLLTYADGELRWLDPESGSERLLVTVDDNFAPDPESRIPVLDLSRDLNGDGRDDLIFPAVDGFTIFLQRDDGSFLGPTTLGPPEPFRDARMYGDEQTYGEAGITPMTARWYLSRVHRFDHDLDGRPDLAFWNEDRFDVHLQQPDGRFATTAEALPLDPPFDFDGVYTLAFAFEGTSAFRLITGLSRRRELTVLHSIRDLDGDGLSELITQSLEGRSIIRMKSRYRIHRGLSTADGATFAPEPTAILDSKGKAGAAQAWGYASHALRDFNGDGHPDLLLQNTKMGLTGMVRAMAGRSIAVDLELFSVAGARGEVEPALVRRIRPKLLGRGVFFPPVLTGDVDGDGRTDLLYGHSRNELRLHFGVPEPRLLAAEDHPITVELPRDERNSWLVDLDRDGRDDLVVHHPSEDGPHRVLVLRAQ